MDQTEPTIQPPQTQVNAPEEEISPQITQSSEEKLPTPPFNKKWLITLGLLLVIIPLLVSVLSQKKKITPPRPDTTVIATIDNKPVFLTDIQRVALEQYAPDAVDKDALRISYDLLTERFLLDKAAQDLHITVSDEEIDESLKRSGIPQNEITTLIRKNKRYDLLKDKILKQEVETREAYSIGFYIASYEEQQGSDVTNAERQLFDQQRADGTKALIEIERRLKEGEIPASVAKAIYNEYPSLQPILALNGYILRSTSDDSLLSNPKLYTYETENVGQPFFDSIYTMKVNEIKSVNEDNGSGGYVIMIKSVHHASVHNYEDWIAQKKQALVKQKVTL